MLYPLSYGSNTGVSLIQQTLRPQHNFSTTPLDWPKATAPEEPHFVAPNFLMG